MTAQQLSDALHALWPHCDPEKTVDRVITGDPDQVINGIAVCWMSYSETLIQAAELGVNTVVTHEPTFYDHFELKKSVAHPRFEAAKAKKQLLIDELGLTIVRCHDVWDAIPEIGVPFEWGRFLGLGEPTKSERYLNIYEVQEQRAEDFARYFASKTARSGQSTIEFYGDPNRFIKTVGLGTGCCSEAMTLYDLGADLAVSVDDIARAWIIGEYCRDTGDPLIVVNHGVSEDCAMESLATKLRELVPNVPVHRIAQGASYREIHSRV